MLKKLLARAGAGATAVALTTGSTLILGEEPASACEAPSGGTITLGGRSDVTFWPDTGLGYNRHFFRATALPAYSDGFAWAGIDIWNYETAGEGAMMNTTFNSVAGYWSAPAPRRIDWVHMSNNHPAAHDFLVEAKSCK